MCIKKIQLKQIFLILFFPFSVFAQEIQCPEPKTEFLHGKNGDYCYEKLTESQCLEDKFMEIYGKNVLQKLNNNFQKKVLEPAYHDNINNPEFMVRKVFYELRIYKKHLEWVCKDIYKTCLPYNSNGNIILSQKNWCENKIDELFELQILKTNYLLTANQSRKERMLLEEKFKAIGMRFRNYIHDRYINVLTSLERLSYKINFFIPNPNR
jgi:hypothetical protein